MLKVSRILHAGYIFEYRGCKIAFDPIFENPFSQNCFAFPKVEFNSNEISKMQFDAVFISHYHEDHCSFNSLNLLSKNTPIYMFCIHEEMFSMLRELGFKNVISLDLNLPIHIKDFEITPRQAVDADVDSIFHIKAGSLNVLNVVDSWIDPITFSRLEKNNWDLILWPFQMMRELEILTPTRSPIATRKLPTEWLQQLQALKPRYLVPSSCQFLQEEWSWYNRAFFPISYQLFAEQVKPLLPNTEILKLNPSDSVTLNDTTILKSTPLNFIKLVSSPYEDYQYDPNQIPTPTAEIAKHFTALSPSQLKRVIHFLEEEIILRIKNSLDLETEYFTSPRNWKLSVFDHMGKRTDYYFSVQNNSITKLKEKPEVLHWTTEIPVQKIFSALEQGESLTSLYLRINNENFEPKTEIEIQKSEVLEDPLIRTLFTGEFATYQKMQLKKLLKPDTPI